MRTELEEALDHLGIAHHPVGPVVMLVAECSLASYRLTTPIDLRIDDGYVVGRAFLFGPLTPAIVDVVALFAATASAWLPRAKIVLDGANVLLQVEELRAADLPAQLTSMLRRLASIVEITVLEVVSLATDPTVRTVVDTALRARLAEGELGSPEAYAGLEAAEPVAATQIALTRRPAAGVPVLPSASQP